MTIPKMTTSHLKVATFALVVGYIAGWYLTSDNIPRQYNCYDLGNFHNDYMNTHYPEVESTTLTALNRQLREICFTNPVSGIVEYKTPGE